MEKPIKINIDNNPFFSNEKEKELVNQLLAKLTKEVNESFSKEHCVSKPLVKEIASFAVVFTPNPDNCSENLKDTPFIFGTKKDNNECFAVYTSIGNAEEIEKQYNDAFKKAFPLTPDECFKKSN